jgi:hypothetical protein
VALDTVNIAKFLSNKHAPKAREKKPGNAEELEEVMGLTSKELD